jgi:ComEC/Rec2-related protein
LSLPFLWPALAATLGILSAPFIPVPPQILAWLCLAGLWPAWKARGGKYFLFLFVLLFAAAFALRLRLDAAPRPHPLESWIFDAQEQQANVGGTVEGAPEILPAGRGQKISFVLRAKRIILVTARGRLEFPVEGRAWVTAFHPGEIPEAGDAVLVCGRLRKPARPAHRYDFDAESFYRGRGIGTLAQAYGGPSLRVLARGPGAGNGFLRAVEAWRSAIRSQIARLWDPEPAAYVRALVLGDRQQLSPAARQAFLATGTTHILSISGLHVSLVAGTFYGLLLLCGYPGRPAAAWSAGFVLLYVLVSGLGIPVMRAGWMSGLVFAAFFLERDRPAWNSFFFAYFVLAAADPGALSQVSFQLSFLSVFMLRLAAPSAKDDPALEAWGFGATLAVMLGTFPLAAYYFYVFAPAGLPANLVAIPLFHAALVLAFAALAFSFSFPPAAFFAGASAFFLKAALASIAFFARLPGAFFHVPKPSILQMLAYYFVLAGLWMFRRGQAPGTRRLRVALSGALAGLVLTFFVRPQPEFQLTVFSVREGAASHAVFDGSSHWLLQSGARPDRTLKKYFEGRGAPPLAGIFLPSAPASGLLPAERIFEALPPKRQPAAGPVHYVLQPGNHVDIGPRGRIETLSAGKNLALSVCYGGDCVLWLENLSAETLESLKRPGKRYRAVILARAGESPEKLWEELGAATGMESVVLPGRDPGLLSFSARRPVRIFNLSESGDVRFTPGKDGILRLVPRFLSAAG